MTNEKEKKVEFLFSLSLSQGEKIKDFFSLSLSQEKKFEENFYINIHELINIYISADVHLVTFV